MRPNAEDCSRYSNTLLVGINNRIYSRSRQSAERSGLPVSNRVLSTAATSIHFAGTVSGLQAPTEDSFQIGTPCIQTVGLEQGKGDDASVEWSVVSAIFCYSCSSFF
jgi:hypothetical protein